MPGFDTGSVMYALNVDFTGNSLTSGTAQVTSNGQLLIGSTATPNIKIGNLVSPDKSITIGYSAPNITLQTSSTSSASITVSADGTYALAVNNGGNILSGTFYVSSRNVANREQTFVLAVGGGLNDNYGVVSILENYVYNGSSNVLMSNFRLASDNGGNTVLVVDVANRNGGNPVINITWVGTPEELPFLIPTQEPPFTSLNYSGLFQNPRSELAATFFDTLNTSVVTAFSIAHFQPIGVTAGNGVGTGMSFKTLIANGTNVNGAYLYTVCPNAATNVQTTNFAIQTNNAGVVADSFTLSGAGVPAFPQAPLGVTSGGTGLSSTTINQILYSSATSTIAGLATANQGVLTTGATGVPVITALGTNGQLIIGSTAGVPAAATLTAGAGISITNGSNSITIAVSGGGETWSDTSGTVTAVVGNGYFITATSTSTLPASPSEGDTVKYIVDTTQFLTITGNTGQKIRFNSQLSGAAGTAVNTARGDSVELVYRATGTTWFALGFTGNWTIT